MNPDFSSLQMPLANFRLSAPVKAQAVPLLNGMKSCCGSSQYRRALKQRCRE